MVKQNLLRRSQLHSFSNSIEPDGFPIRTEHQLQRRSESLISQ